MDMQRAPSPQTVYDVFALQAHANPQQAAIIDDGAQALPRNAMGKVLRRKLAQAVAQKVKLS
jgi:hypothetical protein